MASDTDNKQGLFDLLKANTALLHKEVESINPVLAPWFDQEAYAIYLARLAVLYTGFEDQWREVPGHIDTSLNLLTRRKSALIAKDLAAVGRPEGLPEFRLTGRYQTLDDLIGSLYVLEGSSLGGQVIYRHLKAKLKLDDDALNFFRGAGSETWSRWQGFKDAALNLEGLNSEAVTSSALAMFETYRVVLTQIQQDLNERGISDKL